MEIQVHPEVKKFISSLEKGTFAKTLRQIDLLEKFGSHLGMPHSKKIIKNIFELRIRGQQEVRILYIFNKNIAVLLHCFYKKSQTIPDKEIQTAINRVKWLTSV